MLSNNTESEKLFSKLVSVTVKDSITNHCRINKLLVTIEWQSSSIAVQKQELVINLTDENDPFFLYTLNLCEEDFQALKVTQGLLIDFVSFPQKFIDLLEFCILEENKTQPKFLLVLNIEDRIVSSSRTSRIDIIETNPFKHLTHLSLKLIAATDSSAKQYLSNCFKKSKERNHQLELSLDHVQKDLLKLTQEYKEKLSNTKQELDIVRKELSAELSVKESKHARKLEEERERITNRYKEEEACREKETKEREHSFRKQIQQLDARVSCLDTLNKEIQDKNYNFDRTIRALESQNRALEAELQKIKALSQTYTQEIENLKSDINEKKLQIGRHKENIHELEQHLCEKNEMIQRLQQNIDICCEQKKALETELEEKRCRIEAYKKTESSLTEQIEKSNAIIDRLMTESLACQEKLRYRFKFNLKQEETIEEKDKVINMLNKDITDKSVLITAKNTEIKNLNRSITLLQESAKHFETELKARENVIKWLNRQMTDACLVPQYTPPDNLIKNLANISEQKDNRKMTPTSNNLPASYTSSSSKIPKAKQIPASSEPNNADEYARSISTTKLPQSFSKFTDSAYSSPPQGLFASVDQTTADDSTTNRGFSDIDPSALSAAFGSGENQIPLWQPKNNPFGDAGRNKLKNNNK